jgi:predicted transcriptional regulator
MIEITGGTIEEQIIKILQKKYPVTVEDINSELHLSNESILRVLNQLQVKGIVQLEPLPDKTYIRLLRMDFKFVTKKRQRKFIKHHHTSHQEDSYKEDDGYMYG